MLSEKIKHYRKAKGFSQETLAQELNVVRQTVSKWENGFSVPDADMLIRLSEVLDVPITALLGDEEKEDTLKNDTSLIAAQLYILNNQLANEISRRKKIRKRICIILLAVLLLVVLLTALAFMSFKTITYRDGAAGDVSTVVEIPIESELFTQSDMNSAAEVVKAFFAETFNGCRLIELCYEGDERSKQELATYEGYDDDDEMMVLSSSFYVGKHGGDGSFNTDSQYDDWHWMLARENGGEWTLVGYGMG